MCRNDNTYIGIQYQCVETITHTLVYSHSTSIIADPHNNNKWFLTNNVPPAAQDHPGAEKRRQLVIVTILNLAYLGKVTRAALPIPTIVGCIFVCTNNGVAATDRDFQRVPGPAVE